MQVVDGDVQAEQDSFDALLGTADMSVQAGREDVQLKPLHGEGGQIHDPMTIRSPDAATKMLE